MKPEQYTILEDLPSYQATVSFLNSLEPQIDLTCAKAFLPAPKNVFESARFDDYSQFSGISRGQSSVLKECVNFAERIGIKCGVNNVSLNEHIFSGIPEIYRILKITSGRGSIITTKPIFGPHIQQIQDNEIKCYAIETKKSENFLLNPHDLEKAINETGAKCLLLCDPNNPTATAMTKENAEAIAAIAKKYNLFVIIDSAFEMNVLEAKQQNAYAYDLSQKRVPLAAVPGMLERSITFFSPAKAMGMPGGIRTSFCVGKPEIIQQLSKLGGHPPINQKILATSIQDSEENRKYLAENNQKYLNNIKLIEEKIILLNEKFCQIFGERKVGEEAYVKPYVNNPQVGGIYLIDFSGMRGKIYNSDKPIKNGIDIAKWLSESAKVDTVPGEGSMITKDIVVRISTSHPSQILEQAFENMMRASTKIKSTPSKSPKFASANQAASQNLSIQSKL